MRFKVIELNQETGEEVSVAVFEGADAEREAEAKAAELMEKARREGLESLRYWVSD